MNNSHTHTQHNTSNNRPNRQQTYVYLQINDISNKHEKLKQLAKSTKTDIIATTFKTPSISGDIH